MEAQITLLKMANETLSTLKERLEKIRKKKAWRIGTNVLPKIGQEELEKSQH